MSIQSGNKPQTIRELMFKISGDMDLIRLEITNIKAEVATLKKANLKAGGLAGAIVGGIVIAIPKLISLL